MGRLRNLSASFKAAAFPSTGNLIQSRKETPRESPDGADGVKGTKNVVATARAVSNNSIFQPSSTAARPNSMIYTPPTIVNGEIEELKPVFSYLSSHSNKLYQEGYFLKLDDLDTNGKPNPNRVWTECFAQLVGTVLSFWDAEALDAAGQDGEVAPSFINLADASIKMIETLPTRNEDIQPLQNVLSISTAGKNRYLLHFNSLHSLTQWTAGIRLAMFENASLQELYTGSLIGGKGRHLNSINSIMTKSRFRVEDWARVRFGAGTPWRRCWCVIEPPDEKDWQKSQKRMGKRSAYEKVVYPKGDIKFYDTKKTKKALPIATITDAYSAYAIYPQSKPLINESTLVKLEGKITIHSQPESKTEGFVFVMPEVHPAVSGFEMMLRWLMPVYDTFSLYGRPSRLLPDTLDPRSLMFAMPRERRYGYLDIIDVAALIHTDGSEKWSEREWRKKLKEAVSRRMSMHTQGRSSNIEKLRNGDSRPALQFSDSASTHSVNSGHRRNESSDAVFETPRKTRTMPTQLAHNYHARSVSENITLSPAKTRNGMPREYQPSRLSEEQDTPAHMQEMPTMPQVRQSLAPRVNDAGYMDSANSSDSEMHAPVYAEDVGRDMIQQRPVQPVVPPPEFQHQANDQPKRRPADRPEMRREKSRMSDATLSQMNPKALEQLRREGENQEGSAAPNASSTAASAAAYAWQSQSASLGVNHTPADFDGDLANPTRPAAVTAPSSTSIPSSVKRKPLPTTSSFVDDTRPPSAGKMSDTSLGPRSNHERDSSPDYASRPSEDRVKEKEKEKVRGGTRKLVGSQDSQLAQDVDAIQIDFGQTLRLTPDSSRPNTAGGRKSPFEAFGRPATASGRLSPFDALGQSPSGRQSPLLPLASSPSPNQTHEHPAASDHPTHSRSHSHVWRPRPPEAGSSPTGLSAEEFVQQRYSMAMQPQGYVSYRSLSSGRVEQLKSDQKPRPSSPSSPNKLQKRSPSSRHASGSSVDYSTHLSAREQEHVARMTGGPLLTNVTQSNFRTPDPHVGLIGAIEARDQEKHNIKKGLQGQMVQAAIDQRHRDSRTQYQHQRSQSQLGQYPAQQSQPMSPYANPSQYGYPTASDYAPRTIPQAHQAYWAQQEQQQQRQNPMQGYNQSMYAVQQQQAQQVQAQVRPHVGRTESMQQAGYPAQSFHQRSQSQMSWHPGANHSVYGGFYDPRR